ncbi:MAG TPA: Trm112 family protein [bacterium (Candidatus Stahlbacteria)]|nr:Trm112 family protein [Candidatus Stahlbacteria bacterium]
MRKLDPRLLKILVCPKCKGELKEGEDSLICHKCGLAYPIREGIPIMLISEAREIKT